MRDMVVVGGGVVGLSVAWRCATQGQSVAIVDPEPGAGASRAAAGMLAPVSEATYGEENLLRLNLEAARRFPDFVDELEAATGHDIGYRRSGSLMVARDTDDAAALKRLHEFQRYLGLESEWMTGSATRGVEPALAPGVQGGVLAPHDHQVDNRRLVDALAEACHIEDVELVEDRVTSIVIEEEAVVGVDCEQRGRIRTDTTVLAAGCWSNQIGGIPQEARPPVRPVKGQLLHLRTKPNESLTNHTIRALVKGRSFYVVARGDGRYVLGATVEEHGFDDRTTVDAVYALLRDAFEVVPGITELEITETVVGFRPGTPDNGPIIGPSDIDGLIYATGHYRNGILLSPLTAQVIAGEANDDIAGPFTPHRFRKEPTCT